MFVVFEGLLEASVGMVDLRFWGGCTWLSGDSGCGGAKG